MFATHALVVYRNALGVDEERLCQLLTFFGVRWQSRPVSELRTVAFPSCNSGSSVVFGSTDAVAAAFAWPDVAVFLRKCAAVYAYVTEDLDRSAQALSQLTGRTWAPYTVPSPTYLEVTDGAPDLTGPMAGLKVSTRPASPTTTLSPTPQPSLGGGWTVGTAIEPIVSANGRAAFSRVPFDSGHLYISSTLGIIDIDQPVGRAYYDVKDHFLHAVPLVMFVKWAFNPIMWRPREIGACLIIDDPLLRRRYGCCDFIQLRDAMRQHGFTTNIAFIPWNWGRTRVSDSDFYRQESQLFSVSIHGCDHTASEFGNPSTEYLARTVDVAQKRMKTHQARTRIRHEEIMVFPQGVFSSPCPSILKRCGFIAAVNTDISPVDSAAGPTLVRDVWDVAIMRYGSFPIYTRRYAHHGLENFAFDVLLGKPCFIVAHHDFFQDGGQKLLQLVAALARLCPDIRWRSPAEVIRRAYRWRATGDMDEYVMYGAEMLVPQSPAGRTAAVTKAELDADSVFAVLSNGDPIPWTVDSQHVTFCATLSPDSETTVALRYTRPDVLHCRSRVLRRHLSVATRRLLSEVRDECVHRTPRFLS